MRPNIDISHTLNGQIKDFADENDLDTSAAYRIIIKAGLKAIREEQITISDVQAEDNVNGDTQE